MRHFFYLNKYTVVKFVECDDILIFVLYIVCLFIALSVWLKVKVYFDYNKKIFKCGNFSINIINNFGWNVIWLHYILVKSIKMVFFKNSHDTNWENWEKVNVNLLLNEIRFRVCKFKEIRFIRDSKLYSYLYLVL